MNKAKLFMLVFRRDFCCINLIYYLVTVAHFLLLSEACALCSREGAGETNQEKQNGRVHTCRVEGIGVSVLYLWHQRKKQSGHMKSAPELKNV